MRENSDYMIVLIYLLFLFDSYPFSEESRMTSDCHVWFHEKVCPYSTFNNDKFEV